MVEFIEAIRRRQKIAMDYFFETAPEYIQPEIPLREAALHYPKHGGKGFRPAILMLTCGAVGGDENLAIPAAAAVEALHVSSLIHDDIMDNDDTRRGIEAVWKKWDDSIAILAGDVLVGFAFRLIAKLPKISDQLKNNLLSGLALKYTELCHGQMLDIDFTRTSIDELTIEKVTEMQYLKTGVLFEFCCVAGAKIGLNKEQHEYIEVIRSYAKNAGTAFQIQDDVLGLVADSETMGKPRYSDIKEGKRTIIALHAFQQASDAEKKVLSDFFGNPKSTDNDCLKVMEVFKSTKSIEFAVAKAIEMAQNAIDVISVLPENENKKILLDFAKQMVERSS